ncbi:DUF4433 domain-containing protein [Streptomyces sp. NPDC048462]|uniref:DUF4433 domain-containing protein n=1 Tax=Streptomyces sp. NPDC048462 TaxID=3365555 RepID=UPI0037147935
MNLESIARFGLLSHHAAEKIPHHSVASASVQDNRVNKCIPGGGLLHSYVNTYFHARNSMMFKLMADGVRELVVIRIASSVLELPDVVVSDGNAATGTTRFFPSPGGLAHLNADRVYAESWNSADVWEKAERKRMRSAEVLVPDSVLPEYFIGCYTLNNADAAVCSGIAPFWKVEVNANVYFR